MASEFGVAEFDRDVGLNEIDGAILHSGEPSHVEEPTQVGEPAHVVLTQVGEPEQVDPHVGCPLQVVLQVT